MRVVSTVSAVLLLLGSAQVINADAPVRTDKCASYTCETDVADDGGSVDAGIWSPNGGYAPGTDPGDTTNPDPGYPPVESGGDVYCPDAQGQPQCNGAAPNDDGFPLQVYASDLISFTPAAPSIVIEPYGAGLTNRPVNFVADAPNQTQTGTLLGFPVSVRFTVLEYTFDYGDGTTVTSSTGGQTWDSTNDPQFTPTDTSHVYTDRGTYTTQTSVSYTAEVNFGDGIWRQVIGTVTATGPPTDVRIYKPKTALVKETCDENPSGPGCP